MAADATATLADRPIKVADRLAAFLLGAGDLGSAAAGTHLRRIDAEPALGRAESVAEIAPLLAAQTRLPLIVCGPDAGAVVAAAAGTPVVLLPARDLEKPETLADARLAAVLAGGRLCIDGASRPDADRADAASARHRRQPRAARPPLRARVGRRRPSSTARR